MPVCPHACVSLHLCARYVCVPVCACVCACLCARVCVCERERGIVGKEWHPCEESPHPKRKVTVVVISLLIAPDGVSPAGTGGQVHRGEAPWCSLLDAVAQRGRLSAGSSFASAPEGWPGDGSASRLPFLLASLSLQRVGLFSARVLRCPADARRVYAPVIGVQGPSGGGPGRAARREDTQGCCLVTRAPG